MFFVQPVIKRQKIDEKIRHFFIINSPLDYNALILLTILFAWVIFLARKITSFIVIIQRYAFDWVGRINVRPHPLAE